MPSVTSKTVSLSHYTEKPSFLTKQSNLSYPQKPKKSGNKIESRALDLRRSKAMNLEPPQGRQKITQKG